MNLIRRIVTFLPTFRSYLKGSVELFSGNSESAAKHLVKCLGHPSFQNELFYSHYGQALCANGKLNEGHTYLLKACELYELSGWNCKDDHELKLAQRTLSALRHISENTELEIDAALLLKEL